MNGRFTRRTLLGALVAGPAVARGALAGPPPRYALALRPARALLGNPIVATLSCTGPTSVETATFEDASLMISLRRAQTTPRSAASEPAVAFPNRVVTQHGNRLLRSGSTARRRLARGERLAREIDLVALFPTWTLDTGELVVSYELGEGSHLSQGGPAMLRIQSGPEAVPALLKQLESPEPGVRARSAALLHRMTACQIGYAPDGAITERTEAVARWRRWWETTGAKMAWSYQSPGAVFQARPPAAGARRRSDLPGGVAYLQRSPGTAGAAAISSALAAWQRSPTAAADTLRGREWIADQLFAYPAPDVVFTADAGLGDALEAALRRLAQLATAPVAATSPSPESTGAGIILATVARFPDRRFVAQLHAVESAARKSSGWRRAELIATGLLELLAPEQTVGGGRSSNRD